MPYSDDAISRRHALTGSKKIKQSMNRTIEQATNTALASVFVIDKKKKDSVARISNIFHSFMGQ